MPLYAYAILVMIASAAAYIYVGVQSRKIALDRYADTVARSNPYINREAYRRSLNTLSPANKARLLAGEWDDLRD